MESSPLAVFILVLLLIATLLIPVFYKRRGRYWFLGGKICKTYHKKFASQRRFNVTNLAIHVIQTRRSPLIGMELTQKTALGTQPIMLVFSLQDAENFSATLKEAHEHAEELLT